VRLKLDSESHDRRGLFRRRFGSPAQRIERSPFGRSRPCAHALFSSFYFLLGSSAGLTYVDAHGSAPWIWAVASSFAIAKCGVFGGITYSVAERRSASPLPGLAHCEAVPAPSRNRQRLAFAFGRQEHVIAVAGWRARSNAIRRLRKRLNL